MRAKRTLFRLEVIATTMAMLAIVTLTSCDQNLALTAAQVGLIKSKSAEAPVFSPPGGSYGPAQEVAISTSAMGSKIYYTLDGSAPTIDASVYSSPIEISSSKTIRAIAVNTRSKSSTISTAVYVINGSVADPVPSVSGGVYDNDILFTLVTVPTSAKILYSLDGSEPTQEYTAPLTISATSTIKAKATEGGYMDSGVISETYTMIAATPSSDLLIGEYGPAQRVTLSSTTGGASVHYTVGDGTQSEPTCSNGSTAMPIAVTTSTTIKAVACKTNYTNSAVETFPYIINGAAAAPIAAVTEGSCGAPQTVTLNSTMMGAVVHYTAGDGSQADPTCASPTGTISLTATTTIKAVSCKANFSNSSVATFSYTVETQNGQFCGGDGTPSIPYRICNLDTLANMANNLSASFIITRDIDASETAMSNNGAGWSPIGTTVAPFTGTLNGQDHLICGLKINRPTTDYVGLFGSATSTISRIGFTDLGIIGKDYVGSVAGKTTGLIQNAASQGSIRGTNNVGGIVGYLTGAAASIVDSNANSIDVSGSAYLGGLAGQSDENASISRSWSSGTVTGDPASGWKVGGLVGRLSKGTISRSYSSATVSANNHVGGLIGMFYQYGPGTCLIEYSHASGNVTAYGTTAVTDGFGSGAGGLAGVGGDCLLIRKSYATGNVTSEHTLSTDRVGGLVGVASWATQNIEDSYATGNVRSAGGTAGGIIGGSHGFNISRSYATGSITAPDSVAAGGLIASGSAASYNSFSTGVVSGTATTLHGGLIGVRSSTITNSYWLKPEGSPFTCVANDATNAQCTTLSSSSFFSQPGGTLYSTWDFDTVWYFPASGALPLLRE
jgi:hypothetical protein